MFDADWFKFNNQSISVSLAAKSLSIFFAFIMAFVALVLAQKLFAQAPSYPDFIVGAVTWDAASKLQDLVSYPVFILGFFIGGWMTYSLFQTVLASTSLAYERSLVTTLIWWLVPVAIGIGGFFSIYSSASYLTILLGIAGATITAIAVRLHLPSGNSMPHQIGLGVLGAMMIGLIPFGIATVQDRLPIISESLRFGTAPKFSALLVIASIAYLFYVCSRAPTAVTRYIQKLLFVSQLGIALFYFLMLPDLYLVETAGPAIRTTIWLWVLSFALVLATIIDTAVRFKRFHKNQSTDLAELISPIAVFATIILFRNAVTVVPNIPSDDYHFGENLLSWWSLWEFGKIPYLDIFPPHGIFGDDIGGYISLIFYDGTAATLAEADRLASTLTMFVAFITLRLYTGSLGLAYISILLFGTVSRKLFFLIIVPFYCLWLKASNLKPQTWLWIWSVSAILLVLLVPPQGLLAVASTLPLAGLYIYRLRHTTYKQRVLMLATLIGTCVLLIPLLNMLRGAIQYVFENGPINQIAYGIPWSLSWNGVGEDKGRLVLNAILELIRMAWLWIPLLATALIIGLYKQRERIPYLVGVALPVLLFASMLTPYTLGRIDPSATSRPGIFTILAWAVLLPILLTPIIASRGKAVLAISIAFVCSGIGLASVNADGLNSILEKNHIGKLWSGAEHGMKEMGTGLVEPQHIERLKRINEFLSKQLAPREPYLDLTGHNADYMYFDRPPPISITAPYNLAPIKQQQRASETLGKLLPRVALIEADNINHDGGGMALRTHLLYRFVLKHYNAELHDGYVYGVTKEGVDKQAHMSFAIRQLTDQNWENGIHRSENAVVIRDPLSVHYLQIGDAILLSDNKTRKITRVWPDGNAIWFSGPRYIPSEFARHHEIQVELSESRGAQISAQLMDHVFDVANLRKIPVAWGLSSRSLGAVMSHYADLNFLQSGLNDVSQDGSSYHVNGADPYIRLDLSKQNIAGQSAGLLKFDFKCEGIRNPQIQIFWWGDDMRGADPAQSLVFTAASGTVIVPLDAYPSWLRSKHINGIRIDIDTPGACQTFKVEHASLNQRTSIVE